MTISDNKSQYLTILMYNIVVDIVNMSQYLTILLCNIALILSSKKVTILLTISDNTKKYCYKLSVLSDIVQYCQILLTKLQGIGLQMPGLYV